MTISGGEVSYEQSRKLAEYENKKIGITFNVTDEKGAEEEMVRALGLAKTWVLRELGYSATAETPTTAVTKPKKAKAEPAPETVTPAADPTAMVAETPTRQISNGTEDRQDPAAVDEAFTAAAPEISDKALHDACAKKKVSLGMNLSPPGPMNMIGKLMGEYVPKGGQLAQIPQAARQSFLTKLEALVP